MRDPHDLRILAGRKARLIERPTARRLIDLRMRDAMACSDPKNAGPQ